MNTEFIENIIKDYKQYCIKRKFELQFKELKFKLNNIKL
jgi:hypothetical protein